MPVHCFCLVTAKRNTKHSVRLTLISSNPTQLCAHLLCSVSRKVIFPSIGRLLQNFNFVAQKCSFHFRARSHCNIVSLCSLNCLSFVPNFCTLNYSGPSTMTSVFMQDFVCCNEYIFCTSSVTFFITSSLITNFCGQTICSALPVTAIPNLLFHVQTVPTRIAPPYCKYPCPCLLVTCAPFYQTLIDSRCNSNALYHHSDLFMNEAALLRRVCSDFFKNACLSRVISTGIKLTSCGTLLITSAGR